MKTADKTNKIKTIHIKVPQPELNVSKIPSPLFLDNRPKINTMTIITMSVSMIYEYLKSNIFSLLFY
jgi:hypothetical protein